jgi:hypothetical protein
LRVAREGKIAFVDLVGIPPNAPAGPVAVERLRAWRHLVTRLAAIVRTAVSAAVAAVSPMTAATAHASMVLTLPHHGFAVVAWVRAMRRDYAGFRFGPKGHVVTVRCLMPASPVDCLSQSALKRTCLLAKTPLCR